MASSLLLNANNARAYKEATLTGAVADKPFTLAFWYKPKSGSSGADVVFVGAGSQSRGVAFDSTNGVRALVNGSAQAPVNTFNPTLDTDWVYLALVASNGYNYAVYGWNPAGSRTDIDADTAGGSNFFNGTAINDVQFGGNGVHQTTARGEFRYARLWIDKVLNTTELAQERNSATVVNYSSFCKGDWAFPDGTTGTDGSGNSNTLTIANGSTGTSEPTLSAASVVPQTARFYQMLRNA